MQLDLASAMALAELGYLLILAGVQLSSMSATDRSPAEGLVSCDTPQEFCLRVAHWLH